MKKLDYNANQIADYLRRMREHIRKQEEALDKFIILCDQ